MVSRHDMPDMRTLDEVSSAPEEPLPPPWLSDGAAMALDRVTATAEGRLNGSGVGKPATPSKFTLADAAATWEAGPRDLPRRGPCGHRRLRRCRRRRRHAGGRWQHADHASREG